MRESIGGAMLFNIMLIFLAIFIAFLAIAVNYAQAFRVKNGIINLIEQYESYETAESKIKTYVENMRYYRFISSTAATRERLRSETAQAGNGSVVGDACDFSTTGYDVCEVATDRGTYYIVRTYIQVNVPFMSQTPFTFPIKGETKVIYVN